MILFELLFEMTFLTFSDKPLSTKIPKWLRIITGFIIFLLFIISIASLTVYSLLITEVGIGKRMIAGIFAVFIIIYLGYTIKQSFKKDDRAMTNNESGYSALPM